MTHIPGIGQIGRLFHPASPQSEPERVMVSLDAGPRAYVQDLSRVPISYEIPAGILNQILEVEAHEDDTKVARLFFANAANWDLPLLVTHGLTSEAFVKLWANDYQGHAGSGWQLPVCLNGQRFELVPYVVSHQFCWDEKTLALGFETSIEASEESQEAPRILVLGPQLLGLDQPSSLEMPSLEQLYQEVKPALEQWITAAAGDEGPVRLMAMGFGAWLAQRLLLDMGEWFCTDPRFPSVFFDPVGLPLGAAEKIQERGFADNIKVFLSEDQGFGKLGALVGEVWALTAPEELTVGQYLSTVLFFQSDARLHPVNLQQENRCQSRRRLSQAFTHSVANKRGLDLGIWERGESQLDQNEEDCVRRLESLWLSLPRY